MTVFLRGANFCARIGGKLCIIFQKKIFFKSKAKKNYKMVGVSKVHLGAVWPEVSGKLEVNWKTAIIAKLRKNKLAQNTIIG